ncbi:hypothetical protein BaRGS_00007667 [Batillaria attramentaria]|uniref:Uncharacterized protein n=1 Tax=Batillaria attramentaria TaxID=370345 RepID=A0ABD0LNK7_9CAEN
MGQSSPPWVTTISTTMGQILPPWDHFHHLTWAARFHHHSILFQSPPWTHFHHHGPSSTTVGPSFSMDPICSCNCPAPCTHRRECQTRVTLQAPALSLMSRISHCFNWSDRAGVFGRLATNCGRLCRIWR